MKLISKQKMSNKKVAVAFKFIQQDISLSIIVTLIKSIRKYGYFDYRAKEIYSILNISKRTYNRTIRNKKEVWRDRYGYLRVSMDIPNREPYINVNPDIFTLDLDFKTLKVYFAILSFYNNITKTCYPNIHTLKKRAKVSYKVLRHSLDLLESIGELEISSSKMDKRNMAGNIYTVYHIPEKKVGEKFMKFLQIQNEVTFVKVNK